MSVSSADERVEPAGSGTAADGGFEVVYVAADGTERRVSLAALAAVRLEDGRRWGRFSRIAGRGTIRARVEQSSLSRDRDS
jgi:hypothetical protein